MGSDQWFHWKYSKRIICELYQCRSLLVTINYIFFKCEKASYFLQSYNHFSFALWKDWKYLCDSFIYFSWMHCSKSPVLPLLAACALIHWGEENATGAGQRVDKKPQRLRADTVFFRGWEFVPSTCICWRIAPSNSSFRASSTTSFLKAPITHLHMWLQKHGMTCTNIYGTDSKCVM